MSKHHVSYDYCPVMNDIRTLNSTELEAAYSIEIYDDQTVWDLTESRMFTDLHEWALFIEQQEQEEVISVSRNSGRHRFDDERQ